MSLNFDNVDIRDVLRGVLGDMLDVGYTVDPAVQGSLSLHTARPLAREAVLPAFEEALKLAGVALVPGSSGYQVVPLQGAAQRGTIGVSGSALRSGYQVRIVPLRYVAAADVQRVLEPLVTPGTVVQIDARGNVVTLGGTAADLERAEQTLALFDVDWLRSQSFGLFPLRHSAARDVVDDLGSVIGRQGPLAGVVQVVPITHLNAILVVSSRLSYVNEMRGWIERFDLGRDALKPRLFVYQVQNGRARDLASVLTRALSRSRGGGGTPGSGGDDANPGPEGAGIAPASPRGISPSPPGGLSQGGLSPGGGGLLGAGSGGAVPSVLLGDLPGAELPGASGTALGGDLSITADETNNALLIMATPERYAQIEAALLQLDAVPLQLLLEASIAEVNLTDQFRYGIQYSFQNRNLSVLGSGVASAALAPSTGGLSAAILRGGDIQAVLDLLSTLTKVRVISAPKLLVLNNRTATLQVGDQVPIATSSAVGVLTANAPVVNTIQLLDTGIILRVTPRVNQSGLVLLELSQEVSASVPTSSSSLNSPTIQQRRISTSVVVQDGQTIAIGGLIRDNRTRSRSGIPVLKDIPVVGALFGQTDDQVDRTELLVLITPHVIRDAAGADAATDELRAKLPLIRAFNADRSR